MNQKIKTHIEQHAKTKGWELPLSDNDFWELVTENCEIVYESPQGTKGVVKIEGMYISYSYKSNEHNDGWVMNVNSFTEVEPHQYSVTKYRPVHETM